MNRRIPWLLSLALAAAPALAAEPLRIQIEPDATGPAVNRAVTAGFNFGNWMQMAEFGEDMGRTVPPAALRFPGGNLGDEHDMNGPALDAFAANLGLLPTPVRPALMVQTRVFQARPHEAPAANRPEDAAAAVRLARERKLAVSAWEIGNEPDLYAVTRGDPSWTAERYCAVFRAQAAAIKAVDPTVRVAGPAVSGSVPAADEFAERFLRDCGDVVDMLTWHIYPTAGDVPADEALRRISEVDRQLALYRAMAQDPVRNPKGHARQIALGVTEYGLSWVTGRPTLLADMPAALWAVEAAARMAKAGVAVAHYFAYQGVGFHGLFDVAGAPRPTWYGFRLLGELDGRFVPATSPAPDLWVHAARQDTRLRVLLLNSATEARAVDMGLSGWQAQRALQVTPETAADEAEPTPLPARPLFSLPARSMTLVELAPAP